MHFDDHDRPYESRSCDRQQPLPGMEHWCEAERRTVRPASVLCTGQQVSKTQRQGRYLPESVKHPARMLPAIARHVIETYTAPGDLVLDPMCGIGTTLIEAMHAGRNAVGVEYEKQWTALAQRGINHARTEGATGAGFVWNADARHLPDQLIEAARGRVKLLLTSPPYGPSCHGQVHVDGRAGHAGPVEKYDQRYSRDRRNLAHRPPRELLAGFTRILQAAEPLLAPGAYVAVTARPWRREGVLIDLPSAVITAGKAAGLVPVERCAALLARCEASDLEDPASCGCGCTGGATRYRSQERLVAHLSFMQIKGVRDAIAAGIPRAGIQHEDLIILSREQSA
ncbi:TRM11 family SAM-dependent methyltransferase [Actinospica robiniae]|uniref:TRM11 family SAM-dependent methyltransferase n=1 Tax=Actinospica robiniae TaxID=304901 RepID=UPI000414C38F|nr:DNA methyltransferase [Actinospica robiniae]